MRVTGAQAERVLSEAPWPSRTTTPTRVSFRRCGPGGCRWHVSTACRPTRCSMTPHLEEIARRRPGSTDGAERGERGGCGQARALWRGRVGRRPDRIAVYARSSPLSGSGLAALREDRGLERALRHMRAAPPTAPFMTARRSSVGLQIAVLIEPACRESRPVRHHPPALDGATEEVSRGSSPVIRSPRAVLGHRAAELRRQQHCVSLQAGPSPAFRPPKAASSAESRAASCPLAPPSLKWVSQPVVSNTATWGPSSWRRNRAAALTTSAYWAPGFPRFASSGRRLPPGRASPRWPSPGPIRLPDHSSWCWSAHRRAHGNRFRRERFRELFPSSGSRE